MMGDSKPQKSGIPVFHRKGPATRAKIDIPNSKDEQESTNNEPARPTPSPPIDIPGRVSKVQSEDEEVSRVFLVCLRQNSDMLDYNSFYEPTSALYQMNTEFMHLRITNCFNLISWMSLIKTFLQFFLGEVINISWPLMFRSSFDKMKTKSHNTLFPYYWFSLITYKTSVANI